MKWVFYVIVFAYMCYRAAYGIAAANTFEIVSSGKDRFFNVKDDITVSCKPPDTNKQVDWIDPEGGVVTQVTSNRVYAQEHLRGKSSTLVLTISGAKIEDSGIYTCRSGDLTNNVSLCVFDPAQFVDPITEVTLDVGRSITFTCPVKGDPQPRFSWKKNSVPISDDDDSRYKTNMRYTLEGLYEGQLTLTSLQPEDSGVYTCETVQENSRNSNCGYENWLNITLNVRHVPIFDVNETMVYAQSNNDVELKCSASAYPAPAYKWYREEGGVSYRQDGKIVESPDGKNESVLVVNSGKKFEKYKCQATNDFGSANKYFTMVKIGEPIKPSKVRKNNATANTIEFNVIWDSALSFPVDKFEVRYIKSPPNRKPTESAWWKVGQVEYTLDQELPDSNALTVTLKGLEEETNYWVRLRAVNTAGRSAWTVPVSASTIAEVEEVDTEAPETPTADPSASGGQEGGSNSTFFGIFFAGGILVVAVVCMFAMRMVK